MNRKGESWETEFQRTLRNYLDKVADRVGMEPFLARWKCGLSKGTKVRKSLMCKEIHAIEHGYKANDKVEKIMREKTTEI